MRLSDLAAFKKTPSKVAFTLIRLLEDSVVDVRLPLHFSHLKNLVSNVARWKEPMAIYFWIFLTQAINEGGIRKRSYVAALLGSGAWPVRISVRQKGLKSQTFSKKMRRSNKLIPCSKEASKGATCDPTHSSRLESFRQLVYDLFEMQRLESFWEIVCFTRLQLKPSNMWQNTTKHNMKHENIHDKST